MSATNSLGLSDDSLAHIARFCASVRDAGQTILTTTPAALRSTGLSPDEIINAGVSYIHDVALVKPDVLTNNMAQTLMKAREAIGDNPGFCVASATLADLGRGGGGKEKGDIGRS